jgi:hypothetical protein
MPKDEIARVRFSAHDACYPYGTRLAMPRGEGLGAPQASIIHMRRRRRSAIWCTACLGMLATSLFFAAPAPAACEAGAAPSYDDIRYVSVVQFAFPVGTWPIYTYEASDYPARGSVPENHVARLSAKGNVPLRGQFLASHPLASFTHVIDTLRSASFFDMRLTPAVSLHLDGSTDAITVGACGIRWSLGVLNESGEAVVDDDNARRFFALEKALRTTIFAEDWLTKRTQP